MSRISICSILCLLFTQGCIERSGSAAEPDSPGVSGDDDSGATGRIDGGRPTNDGSEAMSPDGQGSDQSGRDGGTSPMMDPDRSPAPDASSPPPPPLGDDACDRFCQRTQMCLFPACPGLDDLVGSEFCEGFCEGAPDSLLDETASLSCGDFVERIYSFSGELAEFCSDEMPPEECEAICEFAAECGFPGEGCTRLCRGTSAGQRDCLARADTCEALFGCIEDDDEDEGERGPDRVELCEPYCNRRSQCVFSECSSGTLQDGYTRACYRRCEANPPEFRDYQQFWDGSCADVVDAIRAEEPAIDARCDAEPEDACTNVCADTVVPCMGVTQAACEAECADWDRANQICVASADNCFDVNSCFGDPEGQELCRRNCDHFEACLDEACPPRIIPPRLTDGCTADCLQDPPSAAEVDAFVGRSCREVREFVYRGSPELRPLCEGNRDFRPTPDECGAFCDQTLLQCIGLGGRNFCTAACASLSREQYQCALENQANCDAINQCIDD